MPAIYRCDITTLADGKTLMAVIRIDGGDGQLPVGNETLLYSNSMAKTAAFTKTDSDSDLDHSCRIIGTSRDDFSTGQGAAGMPAHAHLPYVAAFSSDGGATWTKKRMKPSENDGRQLGKT